MAPALTKHNITDDCCPVNTLTVGPIRKLHPNPFNEYACDVEVNKVAKREAGKYNSKQLNDFMD